MRGWKALKPSPSANSGKADAVSQRAPTRLSRIDRDRRRDELRDAGHQHDRADLEGVVPAHKGEEDRHQIDRAEQADAEAKAQSAADRKASAAVSVESCTTGCAVRSERRTNKAMPSDARRDSSAMQVGDSPAALRRFLQADLEAGKRRRQQHEREQIELGKFAPDRAFCRGSRNGVAEAAISPG